MMSLKKILLHKRFITLITKIQNFLKTKIQTSQCCSLYSHSFNDFRNRFNMYIFFSLKLFSIFIDCRNQYGKSWHRVIWGVGVIWLQVGVIWHPPASYDTHPTTHLPKKCQIFNKMSMGKTSQEYVDIRTTFIFSKYWFF